MNKIALGVVAVLVLLGAGTWYLTQSLNSSSALTLDEDARVRGVVAEFGTKLQFVPLLATSSERRVAMEQYYGPYVASELIAQWAPEGAEALGRYSSSPWPERIEVVSIEKTGAKAYKVEGNVIEVTSVEAEQGKAAAAIYPVTLALEEREGKLLIVKMEKGAYSEIPHRQTVVGFWECLPHKDTSGPQTMECALGIAIDQSDGHLAVNTSLMSTYPVDFPTGTKVRVKGVVVPANQLSSNQWQKYDIDGIISATTIEKVQ